jgi:hypothetical protein
MPDRITSSELPAIALAASTKRAKEPAPKRRGGKRDGAGSKRKRSYGPLVSKIKGRLAALGLSDSVKNVTSVIRDIRVEDPDFYPGLSEGTLCKYYFRYRHRPEPVSMTAMTPLALAKEPPGRGHLMSLLQKWGSSPEQARELITRLIVVAGHRLEHLDELFDRMERRDTWDPGRKLKWIGEQADKMAANPMYWPVTGRSRTDISTDKVLAALISGPKSKEELMKITGLPENTVWNVTKLLKREGKIIAIAPGVWALPGAAPHVLAKDSILVALTAAGEEMSVDELVAAIPSKPRITISGAANSLAAEGKIVRIRPGVYTLPQPNIKRWVPLTHLTFQRLVDEPGHCIQRTALEKIIGRGLSTALHTLRRSGLVAPGAIGTRKATIKLTSAARRRVGRGAVIRDLRGAVIWSPHAREEKAHSRVGEQPRDHDNP